MGSIQVIKIEHLMQKKVRVDVEVRTSIGRFTFPVDFENHGSAALNEREAFGELQKFLEEALEVVRLKLV
jgi:hypothetical protein